MPPHQQYMFMLKGYYIATNGSDNMELLIGQSMEELVMTLCSFPFPNRNESYQDHEIICDQNRANENCQSFFNKVTNREATIYKQQYFSIENELINALGVCNIY